MSSHMWVDFSLLNMSNAPGRMTLHAGNRTLAWVFSSHNLTYVDKIYVAHNLHLLDTRIHTEYIISGETI